MKVMIAALILLLPVTARAAMVTVEACEPVQIRGETFNRLTLALASNDLATAVLIDGAFTGDPDTCRVLTATAPPGWSATVGFQGNAFFEPAPGSVVSIGPDPVHGFQVVLNHSIACVDVVFIDSVVVGSTFVCFADCLVTPARSTTWGRLKETYR